MRLGIPKITFYRWYDKYLGDDPEALEDKGVYSVGPNHQQDLRFVDFF
jgi:hypothetical protein